MKYIKYKVLGYTKQCDPVTETVGITETLSEVSVTYSDANLLAAKRDAYNGEYTIEDDGVEIPIETSAQDDTDAMIIDHEYRLTLLELDLTV